MVQIYLIFYLKAKIVCSAWFKEYLSFGVCNGYFNGSGCYRLKSGDLFTTYGSAIK
jgi:hypothetical protein